MRIHSLRGYTFIELLVVIGILAVITTTSIVAFVRFREKSQAQTDALDLASHLRRIQVSSSAVDVPVGCTGINYYSVNMSGSTLLVSVSCAVGSVAEVTELGFNLKKSSYVANYTIVFDSRTVSATAVDIDICSGGYLYRISVSALANISQPSYQGSC